MLYDYIIIGGGIIGTSIAREMSKYELKVLLIEKENEIGTIQTLHNSAIIHAGNDPKENTLKSKLNVLGNKMYDDLKKDLNIPLKRVGAFTVAHNEKELEELKILLQRATLNKVPGAYITTGTEARKLEPNLSKKITHVLFTPTTKITNPILTAQILMKNAYYNGVSLSLNTTVININYHNNSYIVKTSKGDFTANGIINAAGIYADNIAKLIDYDFPYHSIPKKGEYLAFDDKTEGFISRVIYPLPSKSGKGILVIPKIDGTMLIGPTNKKQDSKEDYSIRNNLEEEISQKATLMIENIPYNNLFAKYSGIRSGVNYNDFYIKESKSLKNFYNLLGMESPALSAAPAIALYILDLIKEKNNLKSNLNFDSKSIKEYK